MASMDAVIEDAPNSPEIPLTASAADDHDGNTVRNADAGPEDLDVEVPGEIHPSADEPEGEALPTAHMPEPVKPSGYYGIDDDVPGDQSRGDGDQDTQEVDPDAKESATSPPAEDSATSPAVEDSAASPAADGDAGDERASEPETAPRFLKPAPVTADEPEKQSEVEHHVDPRLTDFEQMLEEKRVQRRASMQARRRRKDADLISDFDDEAQAFVGKMMKVSDSDRTLNEQGKVAAGKLILLPQVLTLLRRRDMQSAFLDHKVLHSLANWLSPMPDNSLPPLEIREGILKLLPELRDINPDHLKSSGIGKAIMLLFKHPKETKGDKKLAQHIISEWSKPIFGVRDEYERRDKDDDDADEAKEFGPRSSRGGSADEDGDGIEDDDDRNSEDGRTFRRPEKRRIAMDDEIRKKLFANTGTEPKPNQQGFMPRARVPHTSTTDYVNRPKSQVVIPQGRRQGGSGQKSRMDILKRRALGRKAATSQTRAQTVSLSGKNQTG